MVFWRGVLLSGIAVAILIDVAQVWRGSRILEGHARVVTFKHMVSMKRGAYRIHSVEFTFFLDL